MAEAAKSMSFETLLLDIEDGIATITLNRPDKMNAFTTQMMLDMIAAFDETDTNDAVKAVIVTGSGRAFCAGADLSAGAATFDYAERGEGARDEAKVGKVYRDGGGRVTLRIDDSLKPVIGAINGAAVGIGATMTCAMDIRLASEKARVGFVFNKIGITPEACSSWFLPRLVGLQTALEWCYTGDIHSAETLLSAGYVKAVFPADVLLEEAYKIARKIVAHSPVAIALTRQMLYRNAAQDHPLKAHQVDSLAIFYASQTSGKEGVASFREKRAPVFTEKASTDMPDFYPWWA
jgi:enoyl-CoA hydratase/carnithine racemase